MMPTPEIHSTAIPNTRPTESRAAVVTRAVASMPPPKPADTGFQLSARQKRDIPIVRVHQVNAWAEVFSAAFVGLELAVACTTTQMESGGRMIYGSDPASAWMNDGPYGRLWGEEVTRDNAEWAWAEIERGAASNGFGMKQLTAPPLIADANAHGGVWVAQHNAAAGDRFFRSLIRESGSLWAAFMHYNGEGPAAVDYANRCVAIVDTWRARLG
jgi:hypothetical protein